MLYSQEKLKSLKTKIVEAFDNVTNPKSFIVEHECEECFEVRKTFLNKDWKQITEKILQENYDKLPLFSPEAFHCFLPAYLIYSLEHFKEDEVCDFVVYGLMAKQNQIKAKPEYWKNRFQYFSKAQADLVSEFMDLAIQSGEYDIFISEIEFGKQILNEIVKVDLRRN